MTTNNEDKAPLPCTLWGQTFESSSVEGTTIEKNEEGDYEVQVTYGSTQGSFMGHNATSTKAICVTVATKPETFIALNEAIQAIASAQRPWLKVEGFEFGEGEVYNLLMDTGEFFYGSVDPIVVIPSTSHSRCLMGANRGINKKRLVAFKPISDSQEAWDAVAGVEVWEGV